MKIATVFSGTIAISVSLAISIDFPLSSSNEIKINKRILGGTASTLQNHPSIAYFSVEGDTNNYCTGSLIGPNVVITAAHCLTQSGINAPSKWKLINIGLGSVSPLSNNKNVYKVNNVVLNTRYLDKAPFKNDLAILTLAECVPPSVATPIDIAEASDVAPNTFITSGFGFTDPNKSTAGNLMEVEVYKTDFGFCENYFPLSEIGKTVLCIDQYSTNGVCFGDGGGPLLSKDYKKLVGVMSSIGIPDKKSCNTDNTISTYIILSGYLDWIIKNTSCIGSSCSYKECNSKDQECDFSLSDVSVLEDSQGAISPIYQQDQGREIPCTSINFSIDFDISEGEDIYFLISKSLDSVDVSSIEGKLGFSNLDFKLGDVSFSSMPQGSSLGESGTTHIKILSTGSKLSVYNNDIIFMSIDPNDYEYPDSLSTGKKFIYFAANNATQVIKKIVANCEDQDGKCIIT
ncbi:Mannan-binding lectin serine protease 1 [Smittium culicis]|uniref:Mannan-binding lectin serine protease 1 n=1 Tax=Smittium culicis TaxID=133412 RepID=A0A1R1XTN3_9FUNG|nr:Mannan-binding lectin serine protease 1 [Smittium culicis]OMJ24106.1 Mannan-binding lectin serine protease 1 [Smittium culicis]